MLSEYLPIMIFLGLAIGLGLILILAAAVLMVSAGSSDEDATPVSALDGYESWVKVNSEPITGDVTGTLGR